MDDFIVHDGEEVSRLFFQSSVFDMVVGKNVYGIFAVVVGRVVGAVSDFGSGFGDLGLIGGCHLRTRLCMCVCGWERLFVGRMMREVEGSQAVSSLVFVVSE